MKKLLAAIALGLLVLQPASAEPYIQASGIFANLSEPGDSTGGAVALGYDFGQTRVEAEASNHMHLGNGTPGILAKGYVEADMFLSPYIGVGIGHSDTLILTATAGVAYPVAAKTELVAGYEHRWYGSVVDFGDSEDGYAVVGIRTRF